MEKDSISSYILLMSILGGGFYIIYKEFNSFVNSSFFLALITLTVGSIAIFLYLKNKSDNKKDAARIVLQEIRRAERILSDYKEHGHFKFTKKIIATNSWAANIHNFVEDLTPDQLDRISDLYSTGEYLDSVIRMVSDIKIDQRLHRDIAQQSIEQIQTFIQNKNEQIVNPYSSLSPFVNNLEQSYGTQSKTASPVPINIEFKFLHFEAIFREIVGKYEPIYHSGITERLKKIAKIK